MLLAIRTSVRETRKCPTIWCAGMAPRGAEQCNVTHIQQLVASETGEARSHASSMYA